MPPKVDVVEGYRRGSKLYHVGDGYYYHANRRYSGGLSLRCKNFYELGCYGRATCSHDLQNFQQSKPHRESCLPDTSLPRSRMLRRKILDRCLTKDPTKFSQIVEQESQGYSRKERSLNMANRLRTSMWRARTRYLPQVPKNLSELDCVLRSEEWRHLSLTKDGSGLMYRGRCGSSSKKTRCLIFMSASMKKCLKQAKSVFCDSTWDGKPSLPKCSQMFSMVTKWDHQIVPLVIVLMESKKKITYVNLFKTINQIVPEFNPDIIHCDNEIAEYEGALEVYPNARVATCLYHYSSRVSGHARKLKLANLINGSNIFRSITRSCLAIPLLPQEMLQHGLETVMARANRVLFYDALRPLFKYLWNEWISKRNHVLSVSGCDDRTTNVSESFNHTLQVCGVEKHPNPFQFIDGLVRIEDKLQQNMYCMRRGISTGRSRKLTAVNNDKSIVRLKRLWNQGHISTCTFLRRASYILHAPFKKNFPEPEDTDNSEESDDE